MRNMLLWMCFTLVLGCGSQAGGPVAVDTTPAPAPISTAACDIRSSANLLIVGDSISMGYTVPLQKKLCGFFNVEHIRWPANVNGGIEQNSQGTTCTLQNIDRWIAQSPKLDVIVWNNGLWNARDPATDPQAPGNATDLATYQQELIQIAAKLKATGARVIFVTTTDIPATGSTFIPGRDLEMNAVAVAALPPLGIEVYDLNSLARSTGRLHYSTDPIHFNTQGYAIFGEFIAGMVRANYEWSN